MRDRQGRYGDQESKDPKEKSFQNGTTQVSEDDPRTDGSGTDDDQD